LTVINGRGTCSRETLTSPDAPWPLACLVDIHRHAFDRKLTSRRQPSQPPLAFGRTKATAAASSSRKREPLEPRVFLDSSMTPPKLPREIPLKIHRESEVIQEDNGMTLQTAVHTRRPSREGTPG
jgi:hypothetical protein